MSNLPQIPDGAAAAANSKLYGSYPQKQQGFFMQRVKIFGGRISLLQWRTLAQLAAIYTPRTPLHLTTRQDIEFHDVSPEDLIAIQRVVNAIGLGTLGAGGDSIRNITVCTGCDQMGDIYDFAKSIQQRLETEQVHFDLPRKFKISFSGCQKACAKPFINDLGFVLQENGLFNVIGAGSLGLKPALGIQLYKDLAPTDVLPLIVASLEFFAQFGDRTNRRRARLRHVREKLGDDSFKSELDRSFAAKRSDDNYRYANIKKANRYQKLLASIRLPDGDISPQDTLLLADYARPLGYELRINFSQGIDVYGPASDHDDSAPVLPGKLAEFTKLPRIIACPGCKTCPNALTDCCQTAQSIRQEIADNKIESCIHISGCPNDCAQSAAAEIGLIGNLKNVEGVRKPYYRVLTGGTNGSTALPAQDAALLPAEAVPQFLKSMIQRKTL